MKFYLNPFEGILEESSSPYSPHTRTLRTGMLDKIKDAFYVFFGNWDNLSTPKPGDGSYQLGLLDFIPFLGLTVLPLTLIYAATRLQKSPKLARVLHNTGNFFLALFLGTKALVAAILVIPSLLIVAAVNLVSYMFARKEIALVDGIVFKQKEQIKSDPFGLLYSSCYNPKLQSGSEITSIAGIDAKYAHHHKHNAFARLQSSSEGAASTSEIELFVPTQSYLQSDTPVRLDTFSGVPTSEQLEAFQRLNYFRISEVEPPRRCVAPAETYVT